MSTIYWDIDMHHSVDPQRVYGHNDHPLSQRNDDGEFLEGADGIVAVITQQLTKTQQCSQGLQFEARNGSKIILFTCNYRGY
jgi:hypothetical protein